MMLLARADYQAHASSPALRGPSEIGPEICLQEVIMEGRAAVQQTS